MANAGSSNYSPVSMYYNQAGKGAPRQGGAAQRAPSPSTGAKVPKYYEFLHRPHTLRPASRPIKAIPSKKNQESSDAQEERDAAAAQRRAAVCWRQAEQAYHNYRPFEAAPRQVSDDCVTDRGRIKPAWCASSLMFDPITQDVRPINGRVEMRPGSAPPVRPTTASSLTAEPWPPSPKRPQSTARGQMLSTTAPALQPKYVDQHPPSGRAAGAAVQQQGRYNPLTHTWVEPPPLELLTSRQRAFDRDHGICHGVGALATMGSGQQQQHMALIRQGSSLYSDAVPLSPQGSPARPAAAAASGNAAAAAAGGAGYGSSPTWSSSAGSTVLGGTLNRTATTTNSILCGVLPPERGQLPERKTGPRQIVNGQSWGQYDPIRHQWKVAPVDPAFKNQDVLHDKRCFTNGTHSRRVEHMEARGVWNPINATWTITPARGYPRPASALA